MRPVLVVDDEPNIRLLISLILQEAGYRTVTVNDGQECLDVIGEIQPGLVLLDLRMPRKSGAETLSELRSRADTGEIPVIIISGTSELESGMQVRGANDVLIKPFDLEELLARVRHYYPLSGRGSGSEAAG